MAEEKNTVYKAREIESDMPDGLKVSFIHCISKKGLSCFFKVIKKISPYFFCSNVLSVELTINIFYICFTNEILLIRIPP